MTDARRPRITVLAGTNGSGKSSLLGVAWRADKQQYFNPDEAAQEARRLDKSLSQRDANIAAWQKGYQLLRRAIADGLDFNFETTLGGNSIPSALLEASNAGHRVQMVYVGLDSAERHIARVKARVARGGHDIPEEKIRERYDASRLNLVRLMNKLDELTVFDNSAEGNPESGEWPAPLKILRMTKGRVTYVRPKQDIPDWARPIVAQALKVHAATIRREQQSSR